MNRRRFAAVFLLAAAAATRAWAQSEVRPRNRGGVSGGQPNAVFQVKSVDTYARAIDLQAADGTVSTVKVPEGVYDLSKLKAGDRIQVNFYVPDSMNPGLRAAAIFPAN